MKYVAHVLYMKGGIRHSRYGNKPIWNRGFKLWIQVIPLT